MVTFYTCCAFTVGGFVGVVVGFVIAATLSHAPE